jgi:hypothetical protein
MDEEAVVAEIVALGHLVGARSAYGVVIARLRQLPELVAERASLAEEVDERYRWRRLEIAARRGETLRALVDSGRLFPDEAALMLSREFPDGDLHAVATAALVGGRP